MNSLVSIGMTRDWDEAVRLSAGENSVDELTPVSNRIPAAADPLRAPSDPCERLWDALEAFHRELNRVSH